MTTKSLPASATHGGIVFLGLIAFLLSLFSVKYLGLLNNVADQALYVSLSTAAMIFLFEFIFLKTYRRPSTGLNFETSNPSLQRTFVKFLGLLGSLGFIAFIYWLFPEYHGDFYNQYYAMLSRILPFFLLLALPYIYFVDRYQVEPIDSYYQVGQICLFNFEKVNWRSLKNHFLGWLIKGFFLPLMFTYFFLELPSGLALYWLTTNVVSVIQQALMNRWNPPDPAARPTRGAGGRGK